MFKQYPSLIPQNNAIHTVNTVNIARGRELILDKAQGRLSVIFIHFLKFRGQEPVPACHVCMFTDGVQ